MALTKYASLEDVRVLDTKGASKKSKTPAEIELLVEVDAEQFPKYAKAIIDGDIDGFSMGCDVDYSKCSHCGHIASAPDEYCSHIVMKGAHHRVESGEHKGKVAASYENCYGIKFFEISGVFDPADETALAREVRAGVLGEAPEPTSFLASRKQAQPEEPQSFHTTAPTKSRWFRVVLALVHRCISFRPSRIWAAK
jgi:hypothetical protein